jgi:hypothetical protein
MEQRRTEGIEAGREAAIALDALAGESTDAWIDGFIEWLLESDERAARLLGDDDRRYAAMLNRFAARIMERLWMERLRTRTQ